ncbi:MAG: S41 family peptidase, partial [bacterium]
QLAFWVTNDGLYTLDLDTNNASKVLDLPGTGTWGPGGYEFVYSPDMQWIAYTKKSPRGAVDIWIMPAKGGKSINVTKLNASHSDMQWSPDGKYLFFLSNRNGNGLYALPLKREEVPAEDVQMKFDAPKDKAAVKFDIDFQDSETRIRKLVTLDPIENLKLSPDGNFYYLSNKELWSASYDGKELKRRTNIGGVSNFEITADGKKIVLIKAGTIQLLDLSNDSVTPFNFIANFERDTRLEQKAAFKQYWRTFNRLFYDQNFHGRDWKAIHDRYEPLLDGVAVRQEFDELLVMMVGELEASHTEVWSNGGPQPPTTPFLGFYFDYSYDGPGIRIKEVPERAPGSYAKTQLKPGEYVMAVNGKDIRLDEYLFKMLNDFAGKDIELTVNSVPTKSGARKVTYKAINPFEWRELDYRNQIQRMREEVDRLSGGRIAYVQIPGMGGENQEQFEREFYEYADGKEAAIIDVRGNGGGNVGDTLATWLAVKPFAFTTARRSDIRETPDHSWGKPTVVLSNENVFSNGETFTYCAKKLGFGTVIGMPTPGYVIWTDEFDMVNGSVGRIPGAGYYRIDGTTLENDGEKPDITVDMTLEDWEAKRDPQL